MKSKTIIEFENPVTNPQFPDVEDIQPHQVQAVRDQVVIIDVRKEEEWTGELGHIPEAVHIRLDTLESRLTEVPRNSTIVTVCRSGGRSAKAAHLLASENYSSVYNMAGGMLRWNELGYERS